MHEARTATLFHGFQPFDLDIRGINGDVILRCLKAVRHHRAAYAHKRGRQTAASAGNVLNAEPHPSSPVDERIPNRPPQRGHDPSSALFSAIASRQSNSVKTTLR